MDKKTQCYCFSCTGMYFVVQRNRNCVMTSREAQFSIEYDSVSALLFASFELWKKGYAYLVLLPKFFHGLKFFDRYSEDYKSQQICSLNC